MSKSKHKTYYLCRYGDANPLSACYKFRVNADDLESTVLKELHQHFELFLMEEEVQKRYDKKGVPVKENRDMYEKNLKLIEVAKTSLYEKYREGQLSKEEYVREKKEYDRKMQECRELLREGEDKEKNDSGVRRRVGDLIDKYKNAKELTPELQNVFIDRVIVYAEDRVSVVWKFEDVFKL